MANTGRMRIFLLTTLTMIAFAANSVLNRLALADGLIDPAGFAALRIAAGGIALAALVWLRSGGLALSKSLIGSARGIGIASLALYMFGFSFAYVTLDAGAGALVLFGGVQITMFAGGLIAGEKLPVMRWVGAVIAFFGLIYLLWPTGQAAPSLMGFALMAAAALGWGVYSLAGRKVSDPLTATAANFAFALPFAVLALIVFFPELQFTGRGVLLAGVSGVVTSGLGYALWYSVLPRLDASIAAIAQLTVPVIAMAGGVVFLGETLTLQLMIASILVLGGVALSLRR